MNSFKAIWDNPKPSVGVWIFLGILAILGVIWLIYSIFPALTILILRLTALGIAIQIILSESISTGIRNSRNH